MLLHPSHAILDSRSGARLDQRTINLGFVALMHLAVIFVIAKAIVPMVIEIPPSDINARVYEPEQPKAPPVPMPPPLRPKVIDDSYKPPIFTVDDPTRTGNGPITIGPDESRTANLPPDSGPVAANARSIPPYPPLELRLGHEGKVTLMLTIAETGAVTAASIVQSSGYERLDMAAQSWVQEHWRYKPAVQNGRSVASTTSVTMTFSLRNAR